MNGNHDEYFLKRKPRRAATAVRATNPPPKSIAHPLAVVKGASIVSEDIALGAGDDAIII